MQTKYITTDEFLEYSGIDLKARLRADDNPSNTALAFLKRIEVRMQAFVEANFHRDIDILFPSLTDHQKQCYKYALMEQAIYILRNGDISTDSGYDPHEGPKDSIGNLRGRSIAPNAKEQLMLAGIWSRKIMGNRSAYPYGWMY